MLAAALLTLACLMLSYAFFSLLVIDAALIFVTECLISICNLLEFLFRCIRVVLVTIGMVLDGELLECLLDFLIGRVSLNIQ